MRWKLLRDPRVLVLPFVLGAVALRLAIAPLGDAIAVAAVHAAPAIAPAPAEPAEIVELPPAPLPPLPALPAVAPLALAGRVASRTASPRRETVDEARDGGADAGHASPSTSDAPRSTIFVPASVVQRALERRDVAATNARAADGAPLGARLAGVGKYRTGLRDGDVVVMIGGTRTPTVEAMVGAAMAVATSGAGRISGRILRGDATYAVVLELPKP